MFPLLRFAFGIAVLGTLSASVTAGARSATQASMEATLICRQAYAGEAATAKEVSGSVALVCRPIAVSMRTGDGTRKVIGDVRARTEPGPDLSQALTPQQIQEACEHWLEATFRIAHTS